MTASFGYRIINVGAPTHTYRWCWTHATEGVCAQCVAIAPLLWEGDDS